MPKAQVNRGTPDNILEQVADVDAFMQSEMRKWERMKVLINKALEENENGGITQDTCEKGVALFKKIHYFHDHIVSYKHQILHHCLQMLLPEGVSEGPKS